MRVVTVRLNLKRTTRLQIALLIETSGLCSACVVLLSGRESHADDLCRSAGDDPEPLHIPLRYRAAFAQRLQRQAIGNPGREVRLDDFSRLGEHV